MFDSLVVLPTGGGKSLCYQVPAVLARRTDIVVSPLISLMKDQVDGLRECGYPAAALYSGMAPHAIYETEEQFAAGRYRLLFVAPERLLTTRFLVLAEKIKIHAFAIDEAHCISHWGHDFRPEYRRLAELKTRFPKASLHAYTATATERVRADIAEQLKLQNPAVLVGTFDRPNLVYRIIPRIDARAQTLEILRPHPKQAAIVYLFGSNLFNMFALGLTYLFYLQGNFLSVIDPAFLLVGMLGLLMTSLGLIGNLARLERRVLLVEVDALALMVLYFAGLWLLYIRGVAS